MRERVLITGASRGIGRATALLAAERGCGLLLLGRPSPELEATAQKVRALGADLAIHYCDLRSRSEVDRALEALLSEECPDLVIHNAAQVQRASAVEQSDELWDETFELNLNAPMRMTRALLPRMYQRDRGRVLFVSSISAVVGTAKQSAYNASKAALVGYMRCLAEEMSKTGLMTAALLPGSVDTPMLAGSGFEPRMSPEEVARTLLFYGLDASRAHNGALVEMYGI